MNRLIMAGFVSRQGISAPKRLRFLICVRSLRLSESYNFRRRTLRSALGKKRKRIDQTAEITNFEMQMGAGGMTGAPH